VGARVLWRGEELGLELEVAGEGPPSAGRCPTDMLRGPWRKLAAYQEASSYRRGASVLPCLATGCTLIDREKQSSFYYPEKATECLGCQWFLAPHL
jgi:hypothetical protein